MIGYIIPFIDWKYYRSLLILALRARTFNFVHWKVSWFRSLIYDILLFQNKTKIDSEREKSEKTLKTSKNPLKMEQQALSENRNEEADSSQSFIVSEFWNIIIEKTFATREIKMFCMTMNSTICDNGVNLKWPDGWLCLHVENV